MSDYRLLIGGDVFPSNNNIQLFAEGRGEQLFDEKIISLFKKADYSLCNLEGSLTDSDNPIDKVDPLIKAPIRCIDGLDVLGLDCVNLANNHIIDYGVDGYHDTVTALLSKGISFFGAGPIGEIEDHISLFANGKTVTIYTVAETMFNVPTMSFPGVNLYDEYKVCNELKQLKKASDYLIVLYHGGTEFYWYGSEMLRTRFHRMADSGADLVVAQHTHCIGLQEEYNGSTLFYGQGDFLFSRREDPYRKYGLVLEIVFKEKEVSVIRHLIKHVNNYVIYAPEQDFSDFDKRSSEYVNGNSFKDEYAEFSGEKMLMFLQAFRGENIQDKFARKFLSKEKYKTYLKSRYSKKQLLRIISGIQFEEFRESLIEGLWNLIKTMDN